MGKRAFTLNSKTEYLESFIKDKNVKAKIWQQYDSKNKEQYNSLTKHKNIEMKGNRTLIERW
jgi:hypothetical protein